MQRDQGEQSMPIVGIDLGTTNSAIAVLDGRVPVLLADTNGQYILPSVVHITPQNKIVVGSEAEAAKVAMPARTVSTVKRHMGQDEQLLLGPHRLLPEEITALILKELKIRAQAHYGLTDQDPLEAVITVPAYFTDQQRRATKRAGELAGLVVERIINEPTAAALAFGLGRKDQRGHVIIYDLGGGTFDVSIVEMFDGILEVKASRGNSHLGGEDFDWLIVDYLADIVKEQSGIDPLDDLRAKALLKQHAEVAKKELSQAESAEINIPLLSFENDQPVGLSQVLGREDFEQMIAAHLEETMDCVRGVLEDAQFTAGEIDRIILVGGSTRIPKVAQLMQDFFGRVPRRDIDPDQAVALGASVQAGIKAGSISPEILIATDVAPFSMGVAAVAPVDGSPTPGVFSVIIPRNTTIPVRRTDQYFTHSPGQTAVSIEIYQGELEWAKQNHFLGEFVLDGIPENYKEAEQINVTFGYDLNGILEVTARAESNGKEMSIKVNDQIDRDSRHAFAASIKRLEGLQQGTAASFHQESLPLEWDSDDDDEDEDFAMEELTADEFVATLKRTLAEADELIGDLSKPQQKRMRRFMDKLTRAFEEDDLAQAEALLEELLDLLFRLEMGEWDES
ncbi:MAG TPA: Hsp70 family protein [Firmicutes bacterium]|nr:Hsp70 family protein [Bacillota bacterium]